MGAARDPLTADGAPPVEELPLLQGVVVRSKGSCVEDLTLQHASDVQLIGTRRKGCSVCALRLPVELPRVAIGRRWRLERTAAGILRRIDRLRSADAGRRHDRDLRI